MLSEGSVENVRAMKGDSRERRILEDTLEIYKRLEETVSIIKSSFNMYRMDMTVDF